MQTFHKTVTLEIPTIFNTSLQFYVRHLSMCEQFDLIYILRAFIYLLSDLTVK